MGLSVDAVLYSIAFICGVFFSFLGVGPMTWSSTTRMTSHTEDDPGEINTCNPEPHLQTSNRNCSVTSLSPVCVRVCVCVCVSTNLPDNATINESNLFLFTGMYIFPWFSRSWFSRSWLQSSLKIPLWLWMCKSAKLKLGRVAVFTQHKDFIASSVKKKNKKNF